MAAVSDLAWGTWDQTLPQIQIGKHSISRLIMGTNPFNALSHQSKFIDIEMQRFYTPEQILNTLSRAQANGINCVQNLDPALYRRFLDKGGKMHLILNGEGGPEAVAKYAASGCIGIHYFGIRVDNLFKQGKLDMIEPFLKAVRDAGLLVGVSTHIPAVVDAVESEGWVHDAGVSGSGSHAVCPAFPEVFEATAEFVTAQGDDGIGAANGPMHARTF